MLKSQGGGCWETPSLRGPPDSCPRSESTDPLRTKLHPRETRGREGEREAGRRQEGTLGSRDGKETDLAPSGGSKRQRRAALATATETLIGTRLQCPGFVHGLP